MISVKNLSRRYGEFEVLRGISFSVGNSGVYGILGPNGAGKSTLLKILSGFMFPTGGSVELCGFTLPEDSSGVKRVTGYLPENAPSDRRSTVKDFLGFSARIKGFDRHGTEQEVDRVVRLCGLDSVFSDYIELLSKGYRQRVSLAGVLIGDPEILILDEPFTGLDPNQTSDVKRIITEAGMNSTVLISSHDLSGIKQICGRILILKDGIIAADEKTGEEFPLEDFYLEVTGGGAE